MAEATANGFSWSAQPAFKAATVSKRSGKRDGVAGLRVRVDTFKAGCEVLVRDFAPDVFATAAQGLFGEGAGRDGSAVFRDGTGLVWCGAGRFLAIAAEPHDDGFERRLLGALSDVASLSPQSDSRAVFALNGPNVRDVLARLIQLDLDPRAFAVSRAAATVLGHVPVLVWRSADAVSDGSPTFHVAASRSYAQTIWHDIVTAGARYGVDVD